MSFERLREQELFRTPEGWHENPCELRSGIRACANPKANCRLERATYEMTAGSGTPFVRCRFLVMVLHLEDYLAFQYY